MRKLCWFAIPFCGAILVACCGLPFLLPIALVFAALGILVGQLKHLPVCLACLGIAIGFVWFQGYTHIFRVPAEALVGQEESFSATVLSWPQETESGAVGVEVRIHLPNAPDPKVFLYTDFVGRSLRPGDQVSGIARFRAANTMHGTYSTYYEARGLYLRASTIGTLAVQHVDAPSVLHWPVYISHALKNSANSIFPDDVSGLMAALLTGDKSGMSTSDYSALQRSGTAHIAAVSGLHLSFFAGLLSLFFRRRSKTGAVLTILLVFLFAAAAEFTPSVMRAALMITMTLLAPLLNREGDPLTSLTFALFVLLLLNPYSIQSISLQLSFGAVAGIHAFSSPLYLTMTRSLKNDGSFLRRLGRKVFRLFAANVSLTLGALVFTTPLSARHFGTVSLIAPISNLLILWAVSFTFIIGLILALLGLLFPAAEILAFPATLLSRFILQISRMLGSLSFSSLSIGGEYLAAWLTLVYVILLVVLLLRYKRPILPISVGVITLCTALILTRLSVVAYPLTITMLDVGQGQCIVLQSDGQTALIDCGGNKDNAGDIAADYLQSLGISHVDLLILTHCHDDHANGVPELFARLDVSNIILPDLSEPESDYRAEILSLARSGGTKVTLLARDRTLPFGHADLTLYAPLGDGGTNEEGLFVLASCNTFDMLVTGDSNDRVEALLMEHDFLPDVEVFVAGHHGSKNSTSDLLLDTLMPETCLISVGYNTYGHPTQEVLSRLTAREIALYRTDLMGHLTIRYKGD